MTRRVRHSHAVDDDLDGGFTAVVTLHPGAEFRPRHHHREFCRERRTPALDGDIETG